MNRQIISILSNYYKRNLFLGIQSCNYSCSKLNFNKIIKTKHIQQSTVSLFYNNIFLRFYSSHNEDFSPDDELKEIIKQIKKDFVTNEKNIENLNKPPIEKKENDEESSTEVSNYVDSSDKDSITKVSSDTTSTNLSETTQCKFFQTFFF